MKGFRVKEIGTSMKLFRKNVVIIEKQQKHFDQHTIQNGKVLLASAVQGYLEANSENYQN